MDEQAFWYVDGDPLKGCWIEMDEDTYEESILEELAEAGFVPRDEDRGPVYGGDLLVADTEGPLTGICVGRHGTFDLELFRKLAGSDVEPEVLEAFNFCFGTFPDDLDDVNAAHIGEFSSWEDLAEHVLDETGELTEIPDRLRFYFDYKKYGNDLRLGGDVSEHEGHYFWSNW